MDFVRDTSDQVLDRAGSGSLYDSMQGFYDFAAGGGFEISQAGGDALIAVIDDFLLWMGSEAQAELQDVTQEPLLGRLEGGKTMAPIMLEVALDANGFVTRFGELRESLGKAQEAIKQAMANYRANEAASAGLFPR
jgi:hypothetical protein